MSGAAGLRAPARLHRAHGPDATVKILSDRYERHHKERRDDGDFVFVVARIPLFQEAVGKGKRVVDLGCRSGALTRHLLDGNEVVGVDVDPAALAKAAERGIEPVLANVEEPLPFPDASFDAAVAGELLEHLQFPDELVREIRRILRPGGVLVGSVPNAFRLQSRFRFLRGLPPEQDPTHLRMFSPQDVEDILGAFRDVRLHFVDGRLRRFHPRLLGRDLVFSAIRP